jgi:hypothetical protein
VSPHASVNHFKEYLDRLLVPCLVHVEVPELQTLCPISFVEVHQHRLLQFGLAIINGDRIIVTIQPVDEGLY